MDRNKIDKKYQWDLSKIYSSITEYKEDIKFVKDNISKLSKYEKVILDEETLYELLNLVMNTSRRLDKLDSYVSLLTDEDTRNNKNQELKEKILTTDSS